MDQILNIIGMLEGTNKAGIKGGFLDPYENFLEPFRNQQFCLLEIGVYQGASLRTWRTYFPHAKIVGIDINPACKQYEQDRIGVVIGSQDDPELIDRVMKAHTPSIVIDDGSHQAHHIITSFERIFPSLQPGGYYIVEDAFMHFGEGAQANTGYSKVSLRDYFFDMMVNIAGNAIAVEDNHGIGGYLFKTIEFIGVVNGAFVVRKKPTPLSTPEAISRAEAIARASGVERHWGGVAMLITGLGGPLDQAEAMLQRVIENEGAKPDLAWVLAEVVERQNRPVEAIAILQEALRRDRDWTLIGPVVFHQRMAHYQTRVGDFPGAASTYRKAIELRPKQSDLHFHLSWVLERMGELNEAIAEGEHAVTLGIGSKQLPQYKEHLDRLAAMRRESVAT